MNRQLEYRTIVRVLKGVHSVLDEDVFVYDKDRDYLITIDAVGPSIRVYQDGVIIFSIEDKSLKNGCIGLYSWNNAGTRFSDIRLDDLREEAPVVYRFKFTTSKFTNFFHQMHSYQDEIWILELQAGVDISSLLSQAVPLPEKPSEEEARSYEAMVALVIGPTSIHMPPEVQVSIIEQNNEPISIFVQSPEPIDWKRTDLSVSLSEKRIKTMGLPGIIKLVKVTFSSIKPNEESVIILLRDAVDIAGYKIEYKVDSTVGWQPYYTFSFSEEPMPTGTVIQIHSGNNDSMDVSLAEPGAIQRFVALGSDVGLIKFTVGEVELRLIRLDGIVIHERGFMPNSNYTDIDVRALRKSDGTGFFLVMPEGITFSPGDYRLKLVYRRNNKAIDSKSQILKEAGSCMPENVEIDIPWRNR